MIRVSGLDAGPVRTDSSFARTAMRSLTEGGTPKNRSVIPKGSQISSATIWPKGFPYTRLATSPRTNPEDSPRYAVSLPGVHIASDSARRAQVPSQLSR